MAQEDPQGFAADVNNLDMIANSYLPAASDALRAPINVILTREELNGPGSLPAIHAMESEYSGFVSGIGYRQRTGCERIDETARALREVIALYRRVDGQG